MSYGARELLSELTSATDPNACLEKKYRFCSERERRILNEAVGELEHAGFLSVLWADNVAYHVTLKNIGKCNDVDTNSAEKVLIIGDNNTIKNSNIGINSNVGGEQEKKRFWEKHPFALALITAIIAAFIMMFSFWGKLVGFIEGLF